MATGSAKKKTAAAAQNPAKKATPRLPTPSRKPVVPGAPGAPKGKPLVTVDESIVAPLPTPVTPPVAEASSNEKMLCWIELVKSGTVFIARSSTSNGSPKEYKNRVLEDMLTELMVELQEEIQE